MQTISRKQFILQSITFLVTVFLACLGSFSYADEDQVTTTVSLTLYNTFSGTHALLNTGCLVSGDLYVGTDVAQVGLMSSATGTYELTGDIVSVVTGAGTGIWNLITTGSIIHGDGPKAISTTFFSGLEWYIPADDMEFILDLTPPLSPTLEPPRVFNYNNLYIYFRWGGSPEYDTGVGFRDFLLYVADNPSFNNPAIFETNQDYLAISSNLFPFQSSTIYRYVASRDCVGNEGPSVVSVINVGGGGDDDDDDDDNQGNNDNSGPSSSSNGNNSGPSNGDNIYRPGKDKEPTNDDPLLDLYIPKYAAKRLHGAPSDSIIGMREFPYPLDVITVFALPEKLQKTGAPADALPQILLMIKYLPDSFDKEYLYEYINWLMHVRYLGLMMLFWVFAYDIQTVGSRYYRRIYEP